MTFRNFRIQLVLRGAALAASGGLAVYLAGWTDLFYAPLAVGLAVLVQVAGLVRYAEKATRDVRHFVDAIGQADFSQGLPAEGRGPLFEQLSGAYAGVMGSDANKASFDLITSQADTNGGALAEAVRQGRRRRARQQRAKDELRDRGSPARGARGGRAPTPGSGRRCSP